MRFDKGATCHRCVRYGFTPVIGYGERRKNWFVELMGTVTEFVDPVVVTARPAEVHDCSKSEVTWRFVPPEAGHQTSALPAMSTMLIWTEFPLAGTMVRVAAALVREPPTFVTVTE